MEDEKKITPENVKYFHAKITHKQDSANGLFIEGWASTKDLDRQEEVVEPSAFAAGIDGFLKNPILLYMHNWERAIGKVVEAKIDPIEGFWIKALISKAEDVKDIATKILEGILRAFSIGFRVPKEGVDIIDGVAHIKLLELYEISIVTIPANREALFSVAKAMQHGTDVFVPYDQLVRDVEDLKAKSIGAPANAQDDNREQVRDKELEEAGESVPEERYAAFLAELEDVQADMAGQAIAERLCAIDDVLKISRQVLNVGSSRKEDG